MIVIIIKEYKGEKEEDYIYVIGRNPNGWIQHLLFGMHLDLLDIATYLLYRVLFKLETNLWPCFRTF